MGYLDDMERAVSRIEEGLCGTPDLHAAAREAGISAWEFQRLFSFMAHVPVGEYIRRRRLSEAMLTLFETEARVIDIALMWGYESASAFARAFRQQYGVTPTGARMAGIPLSPYPRIDLAKYAKGVADGMQKQNNLAAYEARGYYVQENAPVYFTRDMERTCGWFRDILGWYGDIAGRDSDGRAAYGCVFDYPGELIVANLTPFRGIHLFYGEPSGGVVAFIMVKGLDTLRAFILRNGWEKIGEIQEASWGAREMRVETIDGSVIRFFQTEA